MNGATPAGEFAKIHTLGKAIFIEIIIEQA